MLPFVTENNLFIVKIGYTTDLIKRYNELKKEFGVDELKLIYSYIIDGEHAELNIHKNLEKTFNSSIYKMIKNEKTTISEETYIFSWTLLKNIYNIIYRDYIMKDKFILICKEIELKKLEESSKLIELKISDNQVELKISDNQVELKISDN